MTALGGSSLGGGRTPVSLGVESTPVSFGAGRTPDGKLVFRIGSTPDIEVGNYFLFSTKSL